MPRDLNAIQLLTEPRRFEDSRGMFNEVYHTGRFGNMQDGGVGQLMSQVSVSESQKGVLRGIHYQWPRPMGKFVTCLKGRIYDVVVDLRINAPTFKQWWAFDLSAENGHRLYVPRTCGHAFYALEDSVVLYTCSDFFIEANDRNVLWCDPQLNIDWPCGDNVELSDRDAQAPFLAELQGKGKEVLPRDRYDQAMEVYREV